jgi:hypothetical protein
MANLPSAKKTVEVDTFFRIPRRVFLDTCVVNRLLDAWDILAEGETMPLDLPLAKRLEIEALRGIYDTGQRAFWQFVVSPTTLDELSATSDTARREWLLHWLAEILEYQSQFAPPAPTSVLSEEELSRQLDRLPDAADRELLIDAVRQHCDAFCTVDQRTILRHRNLLRSFPCRIISPTEWWAEIRPWAAIWL